MSVVGHFSERRGQCSVFRDSAFAAGDIRGVLRTELGVPVISRCDKTIFLVNQAFTFFLKWRSMELIDKLHFL